MHNSQTWQSLQYNTSLITDTSSKGSLPVTTINQTTSFNAESARQSAEVTRNHMNVYTSTVAVKKKFPLHSYFRWVALHLHRVCIVFAKHWICIPRCLPSAFQFSYIFRLTSLQSIEGRLVINEQVFSSMMVYVSD